MKVLRLIIYILISLIILLVVIPNLFNSREKKAFDGSDRSSKRFVISETDDSVKTAITDFYKRNKLVNFLFGEHYRPLWNESVWVPKFTWATDSLDLKIIERGGGQQTISFDLADEDGYHYTLRSVDKDQANALPEFWRLTGIRTLMRDQGSALNPYAAPVVAALATAAEIPHTSPQLIFNSVTKSDTQSTRLELDNRLMVIEIEPDESWNHHKYFGENIQLLDSEEFLSQLKANIIKVDAVNYGYCRLFDILIGDWDRHSGQWVWLVNETTKVARPLPMDRDMAFYRFNDGFINKVLLNFNNKFQTFSDGYEDLNGYFKNGLELDSIILPLVSAKQMNNNASILQAKLTDEKILESFKHYPPEIFKILGIKHQLQLKSRLDNIDSVADWMSIHWQNNY